GFRSVYGPARLCPDPDVDASGWLAFMEALAREVGGRPVLIASSDRFVTAIARYADALTGWYTLSSETQLQGILADKHTQYELAARHGLAMPRTQCARTPDDVREFARSATFPCLLKPIHFREWLRCPADHPLFRRKVAIAQSEADLRESYRRAAEINPFVILQEI